MSTSSRVISISTGTIVRTIFILIAIGIGWMIRDILFYVFVAFLMAGVMYPFARWAEKYKIPKGLAVICVYVLTLGAIALLFALILPTVLDEARMVAASYGKSIGWLTDGATTIKDFAARLGIATGAAPGLLGLQSQLQDIAGGIFSTVTDAFGALAGVIIVFVLSFYIIIEESAIKKLFRDVVPREHLDFAHHMVTQMMSKLGDWMRGQILMGFVMGILYLIMSLAIGIPYPLLIAIFGGFMEFIPYLGPIISGIPAVLLALTISPTHALIMVIVIILLHQLENHVIAPKVIEKTVGLSPVISIIAFLIGLQLFGVIGGIIAIPVATAGSLGWSEWLDFQQRQRRNN